MRYLLAIYVGAVAVSLLACGGGGEGRATLSPVSTLAGTPAAIGSASTGTYQPGGPTQRLPSLTATLVEPTREPGMAEMIAAARADRAARVSEPELQKMEVILIRRRDWPDSCLGLPRPAEQCADVITPGYEIWLGPPLGSMYVYRAAGPENVRFDTIINVRFERIIPEGQAAGAALLVIPRGEG